MWFAVLAGRLTRGAEDRSGWRTRQVLKPSSVTCSTCTRAMVIVDGRERTDPRTALLAMREARGCVELILRLFLETRPATAALCEADRFRHMLTMLPPHAREAMLVSAQADATAASPVPDGDGASTSP
jgi:hypothetical protein